MSKGKIVICINDLVDGLKKDDEYIVEQELNRSGVLYYTVKDRYGVFNDYLASRFIDTKQVVINGEEARLSNVPSLSPYWVVKLFKKKGKTLYTYDFEINNIKNYYALIDNNKCRTSYMMHYTMYSEKKIYDKIYDKLDLIDIYSMFDKISREDKDLIDIVKEINNEEIIKIVNIPIDVEYSIEELGCSFAEEIEEKHRRWS